MTETPIIRSAVYADALKKTRHVFVRGLQVEARVGIYEHEKQQVQRLIVSVDLTVREERDGNEDQLEKVVCYETVVKRIKAICSQGHVNLIETIAERIAQDCLEDWRVLAARVCVEKPDVFDDCETVGIEIERLRAKI